MTFGSLFSGAGGFDHGFINQGFDCLWTAEVDRNASNVLAKLGSPNLGDVTKIDPETLEVPDVLVWGSPCQDLSVASNTRKGLEGNSSKLFYEGIRIAQSLFRRGLKFSIWENVAGALHSNGGNDFRKVLIAFLECGASDVTWRVLDAQYFGVPQTRRRVFVIASARALGRSPDWLCDYAHPSRIQFAQGQNDGLDDTTGETSLAQVAREPWRSGRNELMSAVRTQRPGNDQHPSWMMASTSLLTHPTKHDLHRDALLVTIQARPPSETAGRQRDREFMFDDEGRVLRWRTPLESERVMGWPDNWTQFGADGKEMSKSARYKMCGNGVVTPVAEWLAGHVKRLLEEPA
jgi:DNA (cytosine-5)-methyltransferase 1